MLDNYLRGSIYESDNTYISPSSKQISSENFVTLTDDILQDIGTISVERNYSGDLEVQKAEDQTIFGNALTSFDNLLTNTCTSHNTFEDYLSTKNNTEKRIWNTYSKEGYKDDVVKSTLAVVADEQENNQIDDPKLFLKDHESISSFLPLKPCVSYRSDDKLQKRLENKSISPKQTLKSNKDGKTSPEDAQKYNIQQVRGRQSSVKRSSSDNNILVETERADTDHHQTRNSLQRKCASVDSLNDAMNKSELPQESHKEGLLKRWYFRLTEKQKPSYRFVRRFSFPCSCWFCDGCSCNIVSAIADAGKGYIWIGFMNSRVIKLCNVKGKVKNSINVNALVDDIVTSKRGDVYISCPSAKCIKVIWSEGPGRVVDLEDFSNYQWYPRGLAVSPVDDALIACLAAKCVEYAVPVVTRSNIMRFNTNKKSSKAALVTTEKCFGYPLRLAINTEDIIIVYDYGFQRIAILNDKGLVLAIFSEIDEITISPRLALCFNKHDEAIIVQGRQPTITDLKVDGSPFTTENYRISELNESTINAATVCTNDHLFVGMASGVINIFKKS